MPNKKILVVYYSRTGNTERVAKDIASLLGADIEKITDNKNRMGFLGYIYAGRDAMKRYTTEINDIQKNPNQYEIIVIGTPIWAWNITPAIRTYILKNKNLFKNVAYFTTSGNTDARKIQRYIEEIINKKTIAYLGLNYKDLKNHQKYDIKINQFINKIKSF